MKNLRRLSVITGIIALLASCDETLEKRIYNSTDEPVWMSMTFYDQKHYPDTTFLSSMLPSAKVVPQKQLYEISLLGPKSWGCAFGPETDTISLFIGKGKLPGDRESPDEGALRILARYDLAPEDMEHCHSISYPPNAEMKAYGIKAYFAPESGNPDYPGLSTLTTAK